MLDDVELPGRIYTLFNILTFVWANGMEGGHLHGRGR
jgi:hypothetical protein